MKTLNLSNKFSDIRSHTSLISSASTISIIPELFTHHCIDSENENNADSYYVATPSGATISNEATITNGAAIMNDVATDDAAIPNEPAITTINGPRADKSLKIQAV